MLSLQTKGNTNVSVRPCAVAASGPRVRRLPLPYHPCWSTQVCQGSWSDSARRTLVAGRSGPKGGTQMQSDPLGESRQID